MDGRDWEAEILTALEDGGPTTRQGLEASLSSGQPSPELEETLHRLVEDGRLIQKGKDRLLTAQQAGLARGFLQGNRRGFAFLLQPEAEDLFIGVDDLRGALHGDEVLARPTGKGREAEVFKVLHRANPVILGTVDLRGGAAYLVPFDARLVVRILVLEMKVPAEAGDACSVRVVDFGDGRNPPTGILTENMGAMDSPGVDVNVIIRKNGLPTDFPKPVLEEAEERAHEATPRDLEGRMDLREMTIFTIDSADAKDLDDAVSLERVPAGWRLGIHIADVAHYVREDSSLDKEAEERGTSVYLVDRVIPMLPEALSNGVCSLHPQVNRLTLSVFITFDDKGRPTGTEMGESVIKTVARLTYQGVNEAMEGQAEGPYKELLPLLKDMMALKEKLRERRLDRGAVDFDLYEDRVKLDANGRPDRIVRVYRTPADSLIEEFMLAANEAIARYGRQEKLPFVYRIHEAPDKDKVRSLRAFLRRLSLPVPFKETPTPDALQIVLAAAKGTAEENLVSTVLLRTMMRARYDTEPTGHFGLAATDYTHFTSPIRRYPDLAIHRILKERWTKGALDLQRKDKLARLLPGVAKDASDAERKAEEAERESVDLKKVEFMKDKVGEEYAGIVTGALPFGLFVEMELGVEGLIPVQSLPDDNYVHDDEVFSLVGRRTKRAFRLGDHLRVRVVAVHVRERRVELALAGEIEKSQPGRMPKLEGRRVDTPASASYNKKKRQKSRRSGSRHEGHRR